jgi:hypothetical protein
MLTCVCVCVCVCLPPKMIPNDDDDPDDADDRLMIPTMFTTTLVLFVLHVWNAHDFLQLL